VVDRGRELVDSVEGAVFVPARDAGALSPSIAKPSPAQTM
jgi:hypothetical protein